MTGRERDGWLLQSREPEYWRFDRAGQPSVFVGNWLIHALFEGLSSEHRRRVDGEQGQPLLTE
jgi:hypothetical protein